MTPSKYQFLMDFSSKISLQGETLFPLDLDAIAAKGVSPLNCLFVSPCLSTAPAKI
jgi:hypothetical protein